MKPVLYFVENLVCSLQFKYKNEEDVAEEAVFDGDEEEVNCNGNNRDEVEEE